MAPTGKSNAMMSRDELVTQLRNAHGDSLVAIVLYGSAASDEAIAGRSDQNVLVIVESITIDTLRALSQTVRAWHEAGNPPPLELTRQEWLTSADVFPMEYADILERHHVLVGSLPLDGVAVNAANLRLQVEQEARGKLLRLRRAVMTAGTDVARQRELLRASLSAILVVFRGVLRLHGETPARDALDVIAHVGTRTAIDVAPFTRVAQLVRGGVLPDAEVGGVLAQYLRGADLLVQYLDGLAMSDEETQ